MNIQNYLTERVEDQLNYYGGKSRKNKEYYLFLKISQLIAAALLPFISVFISDDNGWAKYMVAFLGTIVTILEGVLAVGKYHEKWIMYRSTGEALKQEKFLFLMQAGNYTGEDATSQFVNRIELILGKENSGWQQMIVKEKEAEEKRTGNKDVADSASNNQTPTNGRGESATESSDTAEIQSIDPITGISTDAEELNEAGTPLTTDEANAENKNV